MSDVDRGDGRASGSRAGIATLVVRDGGILDRFANEVLGAADDARGRALEQVDDLYAALASVGGVENGHSASTPSPRPACVAYSIAADDEPEIIREAFRRLDPEIRVVLIDALEDHPGGRRGTDLRLSELTPTEAGFKRLANALQIPRPNAEDQCAEREGAVASALAADPDEATKPAADPIDRSPPTRMPPRSPSTPQSIADSERDVVDLVVGDALLAFAARSRRNALRQAEPRQTEPQETPASPDAEPVPPASRGDDETLGDVDLVLAVQSGGAHLRGRAIQLLRAQSGIADVELVSDETTARGATVSHAGRRYGSLVSATATSADLAAWADWLGHWLSLDRHLRELEQLAWTDELTGAGNRRAFERALDDAIAAARRDRRHVTLMCFDIDDFKSYNDRFGHDAGDAVLREIVALLRAVIRKGDLVFRVGGDEFVVLFADGRGARSAGTAAMLQPGIDSVETIANRFRQRVAELRLSQLGLDAPGTVGISAGVATFPWDGHDARSLLRHADQLALQSKRAGKNAITFGPGARDHCCDC